MNGLGADMVARMVSRWYELEEKKEKLWWKASILQTIYTPKYLGSFPAPLQLGFPPRQPFWTNDVIYSS
jgi:hypothetical protein